MSTETLKHIQYQFISTITNVKQLKTKQPVWFYFSWRIVQQNEGREIRGQDITGNKSGNIQLNTQLKAISKLIFNKETNRFLPKKSILCLNYIEGNQKISKLAGILTIDLAQVITSSSFNEFHNYPLDRTPFKQSQITLKIVSKKLNEQSINSLRWQAKNLSIDSLFDRTSDNSRIIQDNKIAIPRKNIDRIIKQQFYQNKRSSTESPTKQYYHKYKTELQVQQLRQQNQQLSNRIHYLQNQQNKPQHCKLKTLEQQLYEIQQDSKYTNLQQQNRYVLSQLQKVSLQLANRQKQMTVMKSDYDRLRKKYKKLEKEKVVQSSNQLQEQMYYLSEQVMRLHGELANYRETEVENNQLKRWKQQQQNLIYSIKNTQKQKDVQICKLTQIIRGYQERRQLELEQRQLYGECIQELIGQSKIDQQVIKQLVSSKSKEVIKNKDQKIKQVAVELQKIKDVPLTGMTMENKKNLLVALRNIDIKLCQAIS